MTKYKQAKGELHNISIVVKKECIGDKPMIRQVLNDYTDNLIRDYRLNEREGNLLSNYCCKLHPK